MSYKNIQQGDPAALEDYSATASNNPQALVLSAYLDEKKPLILTNA